MTGPTDGSNDGPLTGPTPGCELPGRLWTRSWSWCGRTGGASCRPWTSGPSSTDRRRCAHPTGTGHGFRCHTTVGSRELWMISRALFRHGATPLHSPFIHLPPAPLLCPAASGGASGAGEQRPAPGGLRRYLRDQRRQARATPAPAQLQRCEDPEELTEMSSHVNLVSRWGARWWPVLMMELAMSLRAQHCSSSLI
jgi:hypothetical protein